MSDFQDVTKYAEYSNFHVADEASGYRLTVSGYSGNAGKKADYSTFPITDDVTGYRLTNTGYAGNEVHVDYSTKYAEYSNFHVADEASCYLLTVSDQSVVT